MSAASFAAIWASCAVAAFALLGLSGRSSRHPTMGATFLAGAFVGFAIATFVYGAAIATVQP